MTSDLYPLSWINWSTSSHIKPEQTY